MGDSAAGTLIRSGTASSYAWNRPTAGRVFADMEPMTRFADIEPMTRSEKRTMVAVLIVLLMAGGAIVGGVLRVI